MLWNDSSYRRHLPPTETTTATPGHYAPHGGRDTPTSLSRIERPPHARRKLTFRSSLPTTQSLLRDLDTGLLNHLVRLDTAKADLLSRLGPDLRDTPEQTSAHLIRHWPNRAHAQSLDHQAAPPACSKVVPPSSRQPAGQVPPDQPLTARVVPAASLWSPMSK